MAIKAAATWRITCDQGKTFQRTVIYKSGGVPFDNSAFEARMMVKRNYQSTAVISLDSALGTMTLGGANGEISFNVSAVTMEGLVGDYVFDIELYDPLNLSYVIGVVRGTINVRAEVTT